MGGDSEDPARPIAPLPFADGFFDFALLVSINHLSPSAFDFYQAEAARVLRPEGTYFGTWYLRPRRWGDSGGSPSHRVQRGGCPSPTRLAGTAGAGRAPGLLGRS